MDLSKSEPVWRRPTHHRGPIAAVHFPDQNTGCNTTDAAMCCCTLISAITLAASAGLTEVTKTLPAPKRAVPRQSAINRKHLLQKRKCYSLIGPMWFCENLWGANRRELILRTTIKAGGPRSLQAKRCRGLAEREGVPEGEHKENHTHKPPNRATYLITKSLKGLIQPFTLIST